jgi:hypothetical protein
LTCKKAVQKPCSSTMAVVRRCCLRLTAAEAHTSCLVKMHTPASVHACTVEAALLAILGFGRGCS